MESTGPSNYVSPPQRLIAFLRHFLPEQNLQLSFPLASYLLLLGASYSWYRLPINGWQPGMLPRDVAHAERILHALDLIGGWQQRIPRTLVQFAFFASLILWTLRVNRAASRFKAWVYLPVAAAIVGYPAFLFATAAERNSLLNTFANYSHLPISIAHAWWRSLGPGFYVTLAAAVVLLVSAILVRKQSVSLPARFRAPRQGSDSISDSGRAGRDVFVFLIGTVILAMAVSIPLFFPAVLRLQSVLPNSLGFFILNGLLNLGEAVAAACLAFVLIRRLKAQQPALLMRPLAFSTWGLAIGLPMAVILVPRFVLEVLNQHTILATPFDWSEMFIPRPLPWILIAYMTAFFTEFAMRGYLQTALVKHFSVARSIFLTGLIWALLPLDFGMVHNFPFGVSELARSIPTVFLPWFVALVIYSVPLGWLYARTRSIIPVALMHGTIALFHLGQGYEIHVNHPQLYWIELALWVFLGWYLFKKYPVETASARVVAQPEPA